MLGAAGAEEEAVRVKLTGSGVERGERQERARRKGNNKEQPGGDDTNAK